jgi:transcriptional regulator with GAF, ATPase, and Fis domain
MLNGYFNISQDFVRVFEDWAVYTAIAIGVLIGFMKSWSKIKTQFITDNFFVVHSEIHELLTELRLLTDSARTQILQFHNGEYFMDGISMRKFSVTHESLTRGIGSCVGTMTASLCSLFVPLLTLVLDNTPVIIYTADLRESYFKQFFESRSIEAFMVLPISVKNQITGFLLVQWCSSLKAEEIDKDIAVKEIAKIRNLVAIQLGLQKH